MKEQIKIFLRKLYFYIKKNESPKILHDQLDFLKGLPSEPILFAGYIKSGNTWLRFLIYNYFNILQNNAYSTLTYSELNAIQHDALGDPLEFIGPKPGFPYLVRTHRHYSNVLKPFEKCIYIYRNPLDTLVSAFHFETQRDKADLAAINNPYLSDIDQYVLYNLVFWELHLQSYLACKHTLMITYEDLQQNPLFELKRVIHYMGYDFDETAGKRSVDLSNFENIKKMGREKNQQYGNGGVQFKGEFTRRGIVDGYKDELRPATIEKSLVILKKYGFEN